MIWRCAGTAVSQILATLGLYAEEELELKFGDGGGGDVGDDDDGDARARCDSAFRSAVEEGYAGCNHGAVGNFSATEIWFIQSCS